MSHSDQLQPSIPRDSTIVGIEEPEELKFWAQRFNVAEETLIQAVGLVGPKFRAVLFHLEGAQHPKPVTR